MNFREIDPDKIGKLKVLVIGLIGVAIVVLIGLSILFGNIILGVSYDTKEELTYGSVTAEDLGVGSDKSTFTVGNVIEDSLCLSDILSMDKLERYNLDLNTMSYYRVWRDLGQEDRYDLEGKEYEMRYVGNYIIYKVNTKYGDILVKCNSIDGSVSKVAKNKEFSEEELAFLNEIAEEQILYGVYKDECVVSIY